MRRTAFSFRSRPFLYLGITLGIILLHFFGLLSPIEQGVTVVLAPVQERVYGLGSWLYGVYTRPSKQSAEALEAENQELRTLRDQLQVQVAQLTAELGDQTEAQTQERFLASHGLRGISARVIGRTLEPNVQVVELNAGDQAGVQVGNIVLVGDGSVAGKIIRVRSRSSEALLLTDSQSRIAGVIQNQAQTSGVVSGEHGLTIKMELIPQTIAITEGDIIVTAGIETGVPKGLVIGRVDRVEKTSNAAFQTAYLQSLVDLHTITGVTILLPSDAQ